jgi:hypothetical protein
MRHEGNSKGSLGQLVKLIPLLSSSNDGEVLATVRAIGRVLKSAGATWKDLAAASVGVAEQRFAREQGTAGPFASAYRSPEFAGEVALDRWRMNMKMARSWVKHDNFTRLPARWQQVIRSLANSDPHAESPEERKIFHQVSRRLSNWRRKAGKERWRQGREMADAD